MADSKREIAIKAGIEGAEDVGRAADKALSPWESRARAVGGAIKQAFTGAFQDIARVLTVGNAISFAQAIDSARKYREEVGRLSATAGPVAQLRQQIDAIGSAHLLRPSEIVEADRGLGRVVYSAKNAMGAIGGLQDEALATGETLSQKLPLGAALMNGLGVAGGNVAGELGRIRDLADALGTSGGLLAAEDRLTSIAGILTEIGAKTDADRAKLEAMALGLGKGLGAQAGARVAGNIIGNISNNREQFAALAGMKITSLSDENGNLNVDAVMRAAPRVQSWIRRQSRDRGMQQMIATGLFGGDRQAGAAFLNGDFAALEKAARAAHDTGKTAGEAAAFRGGEAGQAIGRQIAMENSARTTAEGLLPVADAAQGVLAAHPITGGVGMSVAGSVAGQGVGSLLGGVGKALTSAGGSLFQGGKQAGAAMAAGGLAAGASLKAGATAGGLLAKAGLVAAAAAAGYELGKYIDEKTGMSDELSGTRHEDFASDKMQDDAVLGKEVTESRKKRRAATRAKADALVAAFKRSSDGSQFWRNYHGEFDNPQADPVMNRLGTALATNTPVDTTGLNPDSIAAIKAAIESANLKVTIENHSESPIAVNDQQHGGALKN